MDREIYINGKRWNVDIDVEVIINAE